jgi:hypothetical protein
MRTLPAIFCLAGCCLASQAQVIHETYDTDATPNGTSVLAWSGGNIGNASVKYTDGAGMSGTRGLLYSVDFNQQWDGYIAYQFQKDNLTPGTSANRGDYVLSFDLNVTGTPLTALQIDVKGSVGGWGGTWTETGAAGISVAAVTGWQHVSVALNSGSWTANGLNPQFDVAQVQIQVNGWQLQGGGPVVGEQVAVDNLDISLVPEPSVMALVGLGSMAVMVWRRKR